MKDERIADTNSNSSLVYRLRATVYIIFSVIIISVVIFFYKSHVKDSAHRTLDSSYNIDYKKLTSVNYSRNSNFNKRYMTDLNNGADEEEDDEDEEDDENEELALRRRDMDQFPI